MGEPLHNSVCTWASLEGAIAPEIVQAPKTGGDEQGAWVEVSERVVRYLQHSVVGSPWANHLALVAAVMSVQRYDVQSVKLVVSRLHTRFKAVFQELALRCMDEWNAEEFFPSYLKGELLSQDSDSMRERFWIDYSTASKQVWLWLKRLPEPHQHLYQRFALPLVPRLAVHGPRLPDPQPRRLLRHLDGRGPRAGGARPRGRRAGAAELLSPPRQRGLPGGRGQRHLVHVYVPRLDV